MPAQRRFVGLTASLIDQETGLPRANGILGWHAIPEPMQRRRL
jgi:hypothetical protein